jgi:hypothetical protein
VARFSASKINFSSFHVVGTDSEFYPASYLRDAGDYFPENKTTEA